MLFFAVLFGLALAKFGESGPPVVLEFIDHLSHIFFTIIGWIMRLAPLGALGAMAYIVGQYGIGSLSSYGKLIAACYAAALLFIGVLAVVARLFAGSTSGGSSSTSRTNCSWLSAPPPPRWYCRAS